MTSLRRNVLLFSAVNFLQISAYVAALVTYPALLTSELGYSDARAGALVGVLAISNFVAILPLGFLSDRVSPRRMLQFCQLCTAVFYLLLTVVRNEWLVLALFVLGGVGMAGLRSALPILCYKYLPDEGRSSNVSLFVGLGFFGFAVGGGAGGLAQSFSIHLPLYVAAGVAAFLVPLSGLLPDTKPEKIRFLDYLGDLMDFKVVLLIAIFVLTGLHFGVEQYGMPKLIMDGLGITRAGMGLFYLLIGTCLGGVVVLLREFLEGRPKQFYYFGIGLVLSGVFQGLTFLASDFATLTALRLFHVMGDALVIIMMSVVVAGIFPGARMGGSIGLMNLVGTVGQFAGALMAGLCVESLRAPRGTPFHPYVAAFTISGAIAAVCGVAFLVFRRRFGVAERDPSATHAVKSRSTSPV